MSDLVPWPDTGELTVEYLLDLVTSEHNQRPRYMQTVALSVDPYIDGQNIALSYQTLFDLDTAVGVQLDDVGKWVGITRYINEQAPIFFSFDETEADLGFDEGEWQSKFVYTDQVHVTRLDDDMYRLLLRARIVSNYWDGTIEGAYKAWDTLFAGTGLTVLIQDGLPRPEYFFEKDDAEQGLHGFDMAPWYKRQVGRHPYLNGYMHVVQALLSDTPVTAIMRTLFRGRYLGLDSAGVGSSHVVQHSADVNKPLFALDAGPETPWVTYDTRGQGAEEALIYADYGRPGVALPPGLPINSWPPTPLAGFDLGAWARMLD